MEIGRIQAALATDKGQVRSHNEDFVDSWEPQTGAESAQHGWLFIVADGVGGADAGEVASSYSSERMKAHYLSSAEPIPASRLRNAIQLANNDLRELAAEQSATRHMATTMVAAVLNDDCATLANVGDSRGYHWRNGKLRQVTRDQSLVAKLVEDGTITAEEALTHPRRNIILSSLGSTSEPTIDTFDVKLKAGDQLLLCSDGLNRHVNDAEIAKIIGRKSAEDACQSLIKLANERGGTDNITVALLAIDRNDAQMRPRLLSRREPSNPKRRIRPISALLGIVEVLLATITWYWLQA